jgi:hypothetical protein
MLSHNGSPEPENFEISDLSISGPGIALAEPITIRIGQNGIVGLTGREIHVAIDGSWTSSPFINHQAEAPSRGGQLSGAEIVSLSRILGSSYYGHTIHSLPAQIGSPHVNCPVTSLCVGSEKKIAYFRPGAPRTWATPESEAFNDLVNGILKVVGA